MQDELLVPPKVDTGKRGPRIAESLESMSASRHHKARTKLSYHLQPRTVVKAICPQESWSQDAKAKDPGACFVHGGSWFTRVEPNKEAVRCLCCRAVARPQCLFQGAQLGFWTSVRAMFCANSFISKDGESSATETHNYRKSCSSNKSIA